MSLVLAEAQELCFGAVVIKDTEQVTVLMLDARCLIFQKTKEIAEN